MSRLQRSRFFVAVFEDEPVVDLAAFLRGRVDLKHETRISVVSAVAGAANLLTIAELELLRSVPAGEWTERSRIAADHGVSEDSLDDLVARGLLISDAEDEQSRRWRQRERRFRDCQWHPCAAYYNQMLQHPAGLDRNGESEELLDISVIAAASQDAADRHVARYGPPPTPFHEVEGDGEPVPLPLVEKEGGLYRALARRKTVRAFDTGKHLAKEDLATLLYWVFGCHGQTLLTKGVSVLHKTSPSGGSLHPVEVYPLIQNVAGVATGLYHYRVRDHSLVPIRRLEGWEAEAMTVGIAAGHDFAADAHVLFLMTARFHRNFWKYRRNVRTHSVILQDAAHLSQTFYLVCADLGLGAFYIAFDGAYIEEALGIDGIEEGAVALAGCGIQLEEGLDHSLDFAPYHPGESGT